MDDRGKEILAMITALEDEDKLNHWEKDFVSDIRDRFLGRSLDLTQGQYDKLKDVYRKFN